jgi:hypothetical protein
MTQEEKQSICFGLEYEPGCVPMEATIAIEKLIEASKNRPLTIMDNPPQIKITWE